MYAQVYCYEEGADPDAFFVPHIWTLALRRCPDLHFHLHR
jgi:hypothetical protein